MAKKKEVQSVGRASEVATKRKGRRPTKSAKPANAEVADDRAVAMDWQNAPVEMPQPKAVLNMRVDRDVLDHFVKMGRGYQTRINAVLRTFVEAQQRRRR